MRISDVHQNLLDENPARFVEKVIRDYVASSPDNRLQAFDGQPIFGEPLVGFADADDPIFTEYKKIIGDFHWTPREAMIMHLREHHPGKETDAESLSVISWVMPIHSQTLRSMHGETAVPTLQWNHTRWRGQGLIDALARHLVSLLEELGHRAVAPDLTSGFQMIDCANGLASNWSQRHMAYAAGLGTFGLSDGLITQKGKAIRCGSVVADLALPPSARVYEHEHANCLFYQGASCTTCAKRCPADAISENGHDKKRCLQYLLVDQRTLLKELGREAGYIGDYLGCGLCQTRVPCEHGIPKPGSGADA